MNEATSRLGNAGPARIRRKRRSIEEMSLASTSDIAFLLIVFFLAASALLEMRGVELPLPQKDAPPMQILKENLFRVTIRPNGDLIHANAVRSLGELRDVVVERRAENPELVVAIHAAAEAPASSIPELVQMLRLIRMERVALGLEE